MTWITYILQSRNGTLYAGATRDLEKRVEAHNAGTGAKFTKGRGPWMLVWHEHCKTQSEAQQREHKIKGWRREKKIKFVNDSSRCLDCE